MVVYRPNYPAHARVSPDNGCVWVPPEKGLHLVQVSWLRAFLRERHIHIVVYKHDQPGHLGKVENTVKRRVEQTGNLACHLSRHELLVNRKLADTRKDAGKSLKHPANVIG